MKPIHSTSTRTLTPIVILLLLIPQVTMPLSSLTPISFHKLIIFGIPLVVLQCLSHALIRAHQVDYVVESGLPHTHVCCFPAPLRYIFMRVNAQVLACTKHMGIVVSREQRFLT